MPKPYLTALELLDNERIDPAARVSCVVFGDLLAPDVLASFLADQVSLAIRMRPDRNPPGADVLRGWTDPAEVYRGMLALDADDVFELGDLYVEHVWMIDRLREYVTGQRRPLEEFVAIADQRFDAVPA